MGIRHAAGLVALMTVLPFGTALAAPVTAEKPACDLAKQRVAEARHIAVSNIAFCEALDPKFLPAGLFVLGLHSDRKCPDVCGSTLMGWFAVRKASGEVFEFDIIENKVGAPVPKP
jgi:hypothetical protein